MMWLAVGVGCAAVLGIKLAGYALPKSWLANPRVAPIAALITVALLAGLTAVQTFSAGRALTLDARAAALAVAAVALWRKAPFIVVVVLAAVVAAGLRLAGWG
jgi:ABC-type sugar transport system permease subunit